MILRAAGSNKGVRQPYKEQFWKRYLFMKTTVQFKKKSEDLGTEC